MVCSAALAAALVLAVAPTPRAQDGPRLPDGKPDFSGIYTPPSTVNATGPRGNLIFNADKMAPVKPGAESLLYDPRTVMRATMSRERCVCPRVFRPGCCTSCRFRCPESQVHRDHSRAAARGADHSDRRASAQGGLEPSYYGDSVGKWEGDTLVIDTVNFKRWILDDYHYTDPTKSRWHSDALHTIERLKRDGNKIQYQITIDDPKIFTRPLSQDFELTLRPDWDELGLLEYVCEENNRCAGGNCRKSDAQ